MPLRLEASSANSTGTDATGMRCCRLCAVTEVALLPIAFKGDNPLRAAHQPKTPLTKVAATR